ncbi:hypothetical protein FACS189451_05380 [Bacteroidia bacterium]|nr:hypothetical protein FACS189451_05380 [Bacteroidia bacterium]
MREKMKKMLFLMLFLLILGAANVNSQVRIGGNGQPNSAAVLDLNATDAINNGNKGLALPRVSLTALNTPLAGSPAVSGMLVFNASGSLSTGVYYWNTNQWVKVSDGSFTEVDGVIGNEVVDATPGGGLVRAGDGTAGSPYTLGLSSAGAVAGNVLKYNGTSWVPDSAVAFVKYRIRLPSLSFKPVGFDTTIVLPGHEKIIEGLCWITPLNGLLNWTLATTGATTRFLRVSNLYEPTPDMILTCVENSASVSFRYGGLFDL